MRVIERTAAVVKEVGRDGRGTRDPARGEAQGVCQRAKIVRACVDRCTLQRNDQPSVAMTGARLVDGPVQLGGHAYLLLSVRQLSGTQGEGA